MESLIVFFNTYGLELTLIALVGIIVLGILKYCNVFKGIEDEDLRHFIYIGISVSLSVIGTVIYLSCIHQFSAEYVFAYAAAVFALNQVFYNIFKVTSLNKLTTILLDWIKSLFTKKNKEITEEKTEDKIDNKTEKF